MKATHELYKTKTILNVHKRVDGGWLWNKYSASPYVGCEWGCEYCYFRDEKYNPHKTAAKNPLVASFDDPFSEYIKAKDGAPELLRKALTKKAPDLIRLGDYQPIETKYRYLRQMLEVCRDLSFPVLVIEKTPTLVKDIDLLKEISNKSYVNVGWSIITNRDDEHRKFFEKRAPPTQARFKGMEKLASEGILTGTIFMPILPFIYDDEENIEGVIRQTKESGGQYVLDAGLSLDGFNKTYFIDHLKKSDESLAAKYIELFENPKLLKERVAQTHKLVVQYCKKFGLTPYISRPTEHYPEKVKINKHIAGIFHLRARELQMINQGGYKEWAYRRAAWAIDDLESNVDEIWKSGGKKSLQDIPGIGASIAGQIEEYLKERKPNGENTLQS